MSTSRKKRIGKLFFGLFIICALFVVLSVILDRNIRLLVTESGYNLYGKGMVVVLLLGISSFFLSVILSRNKTVKIIVYLLLGIVIVFLALYLFVVKPFQVKGNSMYPNLLNGEYVLASLTSYRLKTPQRGDVVIFKDPNRSSTSVARIVGLPDEIISIRQGKIYINDKLLVEPYLAEGAITNPGKFISERGASIPKGMYAVLGDNRVHSLDSREYGLIKLSNIEAKVFYVYWPKDHAGFLKSDQSQLIESLPNNLSEATPTPSALVSCRTLGAKMVTGPDGGKIGCDIETDGPIDLSKSYCEGQKTLTRKLLIPDAYQRRNQYYATLTGLDMGEEVRVFIYTLSGSKVECLPSLNK